MLLMLAASAATASHRCPTQGSPSDHGNLPAKRKSARRQRSDRHTGQTSPVQTAPSQAAPHTKPLPKISPEARYDTQGEITVIPQTVFRFHSPYEGAGSLQSRSETAATETATAYLGARLTRRLEVYIDPEAALGNGLSGGRGLAGITNGDLIGQQSLRPYPYLARYFVRWRVPIAGAGVPERQIGRAPNIIAGTFPVKRLTLTAGKFAVTDVFDVNAYANNPRTQFLNLAFVNNLAFDFPQDPRGYDLGAAGAWIDPKFAVRIGTFAMPTSAGGADFAWNYQHSHSEELEGEIHPRIIPKKLAAILRMLVWRNAGPMASFRDALAAALSRAPVLGPAARQGTVRTGVGLSLEQSLGDDAGTGVFARLGWADGSIQSYMFAECDQAISLGAQLSGAHWRRKDDRVGLAYAHNDISASHQAYLGAGGIGLNLGDGRLQYGSEQTLEAYYSWQVTAPFALTADYQFVLNPGYNAARGPVDVVALRAHLAF